MTESRTTYRVCPFCESTCGLAIETRGDEIVRVKGDRDDPFSQGFLCPKAIGVKQFFEDPDRLRRPLRKRGNDFEEIDWETAYDEIGARLNAIRTEHGNDAVGMYTGNPVVHDLGALLYRPVFQRALATRSLFNSAAIDTLPKIVQTGLMFGTPFPLGIPVPDIDRTDHLLIIGANPVVSHGSLMTMPGAPRRLKAVRERGGKVVVIDPRRSETAEIASEHVFLRPGTDAALLLAMVHTLFDEGLVDLGSAEALVQDPEPVRALAASYAPEAVAEFTGVDAATIRRLAREFASAPSAACYGRLGTCVQEFGLLASWGCDLLNILTGNLDRPGGVMFPEPAAPVDAALPPDPFAMNRWQSRVGGQPEVEGLIPSSTMAEEILTPGDGQVRAMVLLMTNALRSAANSARLEEAFTSLDFLVAIDFYLNETTRHADIILPTPSPAEQPSYEIGFYNLSVRNVAKWSGKALEVEDTPHDTWEVLANLGARLMGFGDLATADVDEIVLRQYAEAAVAGASHWDGITVDEVVEKVGREPGPERLVDMLLRLGPRGDGFGRRDGGLTLDRVKEAEHGLDLGPLEPRLGDLLRTPDHKVQIAPDRMVEDLARLEKALGAAQSADDLLLIGRRTLHLSNSFMHNLPGLNKGPERCTLMVSETDARRLGLETDGAARVTSRVGSLVARVEVSDEVMPGVVSLPHGFGRGGPGTRLGVAGTRPGVNANLLSDEQAYDEGSGAAVLFGTPVRIERAIPPA